MRPSFRLTIDGAAPSAELARRLLTIQLVDKEGSESDTISLTLNNSPAAAVPRTGAIIRAWMGYGTPAYMGAFTAEEISLEIAPDTMTITGRSASMKGAAKTPKTRSFDEMSIAEIVQQIAGENGLTASVDAEIGAFVYPYIAQTAETDYAFLERIAGRHGALFTVKDGKAIMAKRGAGTTPGGEALTALTIFRTSMIEGTASFRFSDRSSYKDVIASYDDKALGTRADVSVPSDPEGTASARIPEPFGTREEAEAAARARADELLRRTLAFTASIIGNPFARAGAPVTFPDAHPAIAGIEFVVDQATHAISKSGGYTTALSGEQRSSG